LALGYVIVLEREIEGLDPREVDGRTLASHRHVIDAVAHEMDLPGLGEFVAFSREEAETLAEDMNFDAPTVGSDTGRWFSSTSALELVQAIRGYLEESPDEVDDSAAIVRGLAAMQSVLERAAAADVRFRLSLDY